ncbi:unnamed protein product [Bursaphelenchus xylophilus]|uniref:poly(ADP-ribose) glycohydrolase n=1 Tax=Bursaphelenchus xylophilus TaxID=6326 RepID=A0A1I7S3K5_BURXY|nr:unnamed protein product [Bursaphelenchus xylophilus]CAG9116374.1 unnamed protein product [Bursaphelenchus xylophilus]
MRRITRNLANLYDFHLCKYDPATGQIEHFTKPQPEPESVVRLPYNNVVRYLRIRHGLKFIISKEDLSVFDVIDLMKSYMTLKDCDFSALEQIVNEDPTLISLIKRVADLALILSHSFPAIPFLRKNSNESVTLSQKQASIVLANAFFLTFEESRDKYGRSDCINMTRWFSSKTRNAKQKLLCIFAYFRYVTSHDLLGTVTILRQSLPSSLNFSLYDGPVCDIFVDSTTKIEEVKDADQAVFANARVGGGVMRSGCVQEEIRYLIAPEALISCMVCERMESNEAVVIIGPEDYSTYTGYGDSFKWLPLEKEEEMLRDQLGHSCTTLIVMDAVNYSNRDNQFEFRFLDRELRKAFIAFSIRVNDHIKVASGNWGCGAFNGNHQLKFIIQLIAASAAGRTLSYHTFGNERLAQEVQKFHSTLKQHQVTVDTLYEALISADPDIAKDPFEYLISKTCT